VRLYHDDNTFLHRLNPVIKFIALGGLTLLPTFFLDPQVPAMFLALALALAWGLGNIPPQTMLRRMAPMLALAVSLAISSTLFYGGARNELVAALGPLHLYREALAFGLSMGLRILCVVSYSALFTFTTDPTTLVYSLIHQAHLSYRLGYTVLAAYRFLPILQREMDNIRAAHAVRGAFSRNSPAAAFERVLRYGVPLLANGVRQAERLAVAMDARGFSNTTARTYYVTTRIRRSDWLFLIGIVLIAALLALALARYGLLRGFMVGLSDTLFGSAQ
jgi:energy-coupling factor transport system permease protein